LKIKKKYAVYGNVPNIGFIREWIWEYSKQQVLKIVHMRLQEKYPKIVVPPLGLYCQVDEVTSKVSG